VREPDAWTQRKTTQTKVPNPFPVLFGPKYRRRTILATLLSACVQFANWGLFFWLPGFLATPVERGGAGMSIVRSAGWIIPVQIGAYLGYLSFGFIADRFGRRRTFIAYLVTAAVLVPLYGQMARSPIVLMLLGPILGFVGYGYFSMFGSFLAELFPTTARATGQGLTYNLGRGLGALAPYTIGFVATMPNVGIGSALALTSAFFLAGSALILFFPDTSRLALAD
jgi:MFS family permease